VGVQVLGRLPLLDEGELGWLAKALRQVIADATGFFPGRLDQRHERLLQLRLLARSGGE